MIDFESLENEYQSKQIDFDSFEHAYQRGFVDPSKSYSTGEPSFGEGVSIPSRETPKKAADNFGVKDIPASMAALGVAATDGLLGIPLRAIDKITGTKSDDLLKQAGQYWRDKIPPVEFTDYTLSWSDEPIENEIANIGKARLVKIKSSARDVAIATGELAGFAAPASVTLKAGALVADTLTPFAGYVYRKLATGAIGGALLGEGDPKKTAELAATFTVFETVPAFANIIKSSRAKAKIMSDWAKVPESQKVPVVQSLEETLKKNPNITEGELVAKSKNYMEEAQRKRGKGEEKSIWGDKAEWNIPEEKVTPKESQIKSEESGIAVQAEVKEPLKAQQVTPQGEVKQLSASAPEFPKETPFIDFSKMEQNLQEQHGKEIKIDEESLVNANTEQERNKLLADTFGLTAEEFKMVQDSSNFDELPPGYKYDLADEYLADLEYAAKTRNKQDITEIVSRIKRGYLPAEEIPVPENSGRNTDISYQTPEELEAKIKPYRKLPKTGNPPKSLETIRAEIESAKKTIGTGLNNEVFGSSLDSMIAQLEEGFGAETRISKDNEVTQIGSSYPNWIKGIQRAAVRKNLGLKSNATIKDSLTVLRKVRDGKNLTERQDIIRVELERRAEQDAGIQHDNRFDNETFTDEPTYDKKTEKMVDEAGNELFDTGGEYKTSENDSKYKTSGNYPIWEMPEIVELSRDIIGRNPDLVNKFRKEGTRGSFSPQERQRIKLLKSLGADPETAAKVLAHEIGHAVDYASDTMSRGNILGRIANFKKYAKSFLEEKPGGEEPLTKEEIAGLRQEARDIKEGLVNDAIKSQVGVDPADVFDYLKGIDTKKLSPEVIEFIQRADTATKKSIAKQAMKGLSINELSSFKSGDPKVRFSIEKKFRELFSAEVKRRKLFEKKVITDELIKHSGEWREWPVGQDAKYDSYRRSSKELYADAISSLIVNPRELEKNAPTFLRAFMNHIESKPKVKASWDAIQERINRGTEEVIKHRIDQNFIDFQNDADIRKEERLERIKEQEEAEEGTIDTLKRVFDDKNHPIIKLIDGLAVTGGKTGSIRSRSIKDKFLKRPFIPAKIDAHLYEIGKIYRNLESLGVTINEVGLVGKFKHIIANREDLFNPGGETAETAKKNLSFLKKEWGAEKYKNAENWLKEYREIRERNIIPRIEESGLVGKNMLKSMNDREDYLRVSVTHWLQKDSGITGSGGFHAQTGTLSAQGNPVVATILQDIENIFSAEENMLRNEALDALVDLGEARRPELTYDVAQKGMRPDSRFIKRGEVIINSKKDGKTVYTAISKPAYDVLIEEPRTATAINRLFGNATVVLKELFVGSNPKWMISNVPRDMWDTLMHNKEIGLKDTAKLLNSYWKTAPEVWREAWRSERSPEIQAMMNRKTLTQKRIWGSIEEGTTNQIERSLANYNLMEIPKQEKVLYEKFISKYVKGRTTKEISDTIEGLALSLWDKKERVGRFSDLWGKVAGERFLTEFTDLSLDDIDRKVIEQIGTPNWQQKGDLHWLTNSMGLYSNIALKGLTAEVKGAKENYWSYAWKVAALTLAPAVISELIDRGQFGEHAQKINRRIPKYYKDHYLTIPLFIDSNGKAVFLKFPIGSQQRVIKATFAKTLRGEFSGKKGAIAEFGFGMNPYSPTPLVTAPLTDIAYLGGMDTIDWFSKRNVLGKRNMELGGKYALKALAKDNYSSLGGGLIYRLPNRYESERQTWLEKGSRIPIALYGALLGVSDGGIREYVEDNLKPMREEKLQESADISEWTHDVVKNKNRAEIIVSLLEKSQGNADVARRIERELAYKWGTQWQISFMNAHNEQERAMVLNLMLEDQGVE